MKYGLFGINNGVCADPQVMRAVATTAEDCGFESVWTGEHVVLPAPQKPPSPATPLFSMAHPSTALSFIAGFTSRIKLGTGITLLAQRNAVVLAKEMASLDHLSGGRLLFGIVAGYLKAEFDALGVNFAERGARTDEYLAAMRELWTSDTPAFSGRFVSFSGIQARPQPAQSGGPPIIVGGNSPAAYRRAVTNGQGWYGFGMDVDGTKQCLDDLSEAQATYDRPEELGKLEISISPRVRPSEEVFQAFEDLGINRLILLQVGKNEAELVQFVEDIAERYIK